MAIHLIPFVAGAVIGGLGAYFYRDEKLRRELRRRAEALTDSVRKTAGDVSAQVSGGFSDLREQVARKPEAAAPAKKAPTKKTGSKVAAKKAAPRKRPATRKSSVDSSATPTE